MIKIILIILISFISTKVLAQDQWFLWNSLNYHDKIKNFKYVFIPKDLHKYNLLFIVVTEDSIRNELDTFVSKLDNKDTVGMMGNKYWAIFNGSETVKQCS